MLLRFLRKLIDPVSEQPGGRRPDSQPPPSVRHARTHTASLVERGRALLARGDLAQARVALEQAIDLEAGLPEALILLGAVYAQQGETARARDRVEAALALSPDDPAARNALGNLLRIEGKLEQAIEHYRQAIAAAPRFASALSNCALCLQDLGQFDLAREYYLQALDAEPSDPTIATNLAGLLFDLGEFDRAIEFVDGVLARDPQLAQAHVTKALGLLRRGDFDRGWQEYEWRDRDAGRTQPSPGQYPLWNGESMRAGALLVCAEQGLGDQIMFASCFGDLSAQVADSIIECDPRLSALFARSFPRMRIYPHRKKNVEPWLGDGIKPAAKTWAGSLPVRFRRRREDFSARSPFLRADAAQIAAWRQRLQAQGPGLKVGISWRGGTPATRCATRSTALTDWAPILHLPAVQAVNLQYGNCRDELARSEQTLGVRIADWSDALSNYDQTAALVCALDLIVCVQTSVVHLAGALGRPAWVLVPRIAEWRYGDAGESMIWYPSVRLFRQHGEGWHGTIARIRSELMRLSDGTRPAHI